MRTRRAPSAEEIARAVERAKAGKGRQLALMVKAISIKDLAAGFECYARVWGDFHSDGFEAVRCAVTVAAGRKEGRNDFRASLAEARKRLREDARAEAEGASAV